MSEFLTTKFKTKSLDKKTKTIEIYKVSVNGILVEITIDESTNTLTAYCWDYDLTYTYRWGSSFNSDKTFKKFIGQPNSIHYFLDKLRIKKDELNLSKSKTELYSYSIHNFLKGISAEERKEWLSRVSDLTIDDLAEEANGDINFWVCVYGSIYIDTSEYNFKVCDYSYQNLIIINGLLKVMEQIQKESE